jgi:hypothetical protein
VDSSRELASIYAIGFVINLYLILLIDVQTSDLMGKSLVRGSKQLLSLLEQSLRKWFLP